MNDDDKNYYRQVWQKVIDALIDWTDEESKKWWANTEKLINNKYSMIDHETPVHYVAPLLIPSELADKIRLYPDKYTRIVGDIQHAIEAGDALSVETDPNFDWELARRRVQSVLEKYESLE